jgi:hypothetical protein
MVTSIRNASFRQLESCKSSCKSNWTTANNARTYDALSPRRESIELTSSGGKCVLNGQLSMLVPAVVRRLVIDYDVLVRGKCERDVNMEAAAVPVFVTRRDHSHTTSNDALIVLFQPLHFMRDRGANALGRIRSLKGHLQWDLHEVLR